ncbi:FecR family protein [Stieleria sp. TO1_6]|uniref:FecR domain-containing protein n=1 Tax=Stieleria tagensis TaxID=2956795 RepID=UPI00209AC6E6|nr:FecR domain-containing protein [Stieleria tagensis]MCO8124549.1 FecR family protein [Stieleria tagensis]
MSQQFEELWTRFLEGELNEEGLASLQDLLASDSDLLRHAGDLYEEHRLLGFALQPFDDQQFVDDTVSIVENDSRQFVGDVLSELRGRSGKLVPQGMTRGWQQSFLAFALAVSILFAGGLAWFFVSRANQPTGGNLYTQSTEQHYIATVLLEDNCIWRASNSPSEGRRLSSQMLDLESGLAVIRFDGGAELVMTGETSLLLHSAGSAELLLGDVVVRAEEEAEGFTLTTPTSEVIDLGTEFAVKVNRIGDTEVHVLDGEVSYRSIDTEDELAKILPAGEGIAINKSGRPRAVPMNSPRFQEFIRRVNPRSRSDLLTAYEGFNYSPGILPLRDSVVGTGWAGPWRKRLPKERKFPATGSSPDYFEIVHGEMNVTWPVPGGRLGSLKLPGGGVYYLRPMADPIRLNQDGVVFFSLMVRETERRTDRDRPRERLRLTLRSSDDFDGQSISFGHGPGYRPTVRTGAGISHTSPLVLPAEQTTLWIGKIVARQSGEDEIYFRVYGEMDVLDYAEPATWHVVTRDVELDANLDLILLSSEGKTARLVDELRIGPTWRSVAPILENAE